MVIVVSCKRSGCGREIFEREDIEVLVLGEGFKADQSALGGGTSRQSKLVSTGSLILRWEP